MKMNSVSDKHLYNTPRVDVNLEEIPVYALSVETVNTLSSMLNRRKLILSPISPRLYRDYRGLANLMGISITNYWYPTEDYIKHLLSIWRKKKDSTLDKLQTFLEKIDRYDVLDDTRNMFYNDAVEYIRERDNNVWRQNEPRRILLTADDLLSSKNTYDAFILYAKEDEKFAELIVKTVESEPHNLKLFVKDRDLLPGTTFAEKAMMSLFRNLCKRLIVIVSNEYLKSEEDRFFHEYVQVLSLSRGDKDGARIIRVFYKDVDENDEYRIYHSLDYRRNSAIVDFWKKLVCSIKEPSARTFITPTPSSGQSSKINKKYALTPTEHPAVEVAESSTVNANIKDGNSMRESVELVDSSSTAVLDSNSFPEISGILENSSKKSMYKKFLHVFKTKKLKKVKKRDPIAIAS